MKTLTSIILATTFLIVSTQTNYLREQDRNSPAIQRQGILHKLYEAQNSPPRIRIPMSPFFFPSEYFINKKDNERLRQ